MAASHRIDAFERRFGAIRLRLEGALGYALTVGLNLPGGAPRYPCADELLGAALLALSDDIEATGIRLLDPVLFSDEKGPGAHITVSPTVGAAELKRLLINIEEEHPLGRLFDLDVIADSDGPLSRVELGAPPRRCLICGLPAHVCRRQQNHEPEELRDAVIALTKRYDPAILSSLHTGGVPLDADSFYIASVLTESILLEASCYPSPGLVNPFDSGGHSDMSYATFLRSSSVLSGAFAVCAGIGASSAEPAAILPAARAAGYHFERRMLVATGGVNTQKGLLFLGSLVAAAAGMLSRQAQHGGRNQVLRADCIASEVAVITSGLDEELRQGRNCSDRAARLYREAGYTGPRGEAIAGLPHVMRHGLPVLSRALDDGLCLNNALVQALLAIMSELPDTALAGRHGIETVESIVRPAASFALSAGGAYTERGRARIQSMASEFAEKRYNPGGSADLLAVTAALYLFEHNHWPERAM